jgi:hypothetical protein
MGKNSAWSAGVDGFTLNRDEGGLALNRDEGRVAPSTTRSKPTNMQHDSPQRLHVLSVLIACPDRGHPVSDVTDCKSSWVVKTTSR